jgi:hypothetical protein
MHLSHLPVCALPSCSAASSSRWRQCASGLIPDLALPCCGVSVCARASHLTFEQALPYKCVCSSTATLRFCSCIALRSSPITCLLLGLWNWYIIIAIIDPWPGPSEFSNDVWSISELDCLTLSALWLILLKHSAEICLLSLLSVSQYWTCLAIHFKKADEGMPEFYVICIKCNKVKESWV